jgi:glycosyltransferase involved in cell wall biosynthesis
MAEWVDERAQRSSGPGRREDSVGINLLWLVPGVVGGSETYTVRLLSGLAERYSELEYTLFALPEFGSAYPDVVRTFKTVYAPVTGRRKPTRVLAGENTWLARQVRRRKIGLVHHAGGIVPLVHVARTVLTIHDLQYLFYPEYFARSKLTYLKAMVPRSAEAARVVLTPSEYTRRTVIERLGIDPSIVVVVPHGLAARDPVIGAERVRARYDVPGPFFIYPAATYPHKNHLMLVDAFARLLQSHPEVTLVLTGARGSTQWGTARSTSSGIAEEARKLRIEERVRPLGFVPKHDLEALYHQAVALVFPSRFEGFGAPILEAWARGCPVIAADATALPEIVGDAGYLLSPDNPEHWASAMWDLLEDADLRLLLARAGAERAKSFTPARSADALEDAYRHALGTTL